ncbi:hypothetical protein HKCCSP123_05165 [Rhodobacterales bacterium HKCCSP123]|nr:hypothetical protein [Rhodobacterales bacterium HKCCSP123]
MLWRRIALPNEDPGSFELFRDAMFQDLQPMTPYEAVIVDNLIRVEWAILEHRRMQDAILRKGMLDAARDRLFAVRTAEHGRALTAFEAQFEEDDEGVDEDVDEDEDEIEDQDGEVWEEPPCFDADAVEAEARVLLDQLGSGDPAEVAKADRLLLKLGTSRMDLMVEVWGKVSGSIARHEGIIRDNEGRRREIQRDLEALQRRRPIEGSLAS